MSTKKVTIGSKPTNKTMASTADGWVNNNIDADGGSPEPIRRLTIDIPESLHRAIKAQCALRGTKMVEEVRALLIEKYANK